MSLLILDHVSVRCASRHRVGRTALRDISLDVERGELVTVAGWQRSGRTTLLQIAAGVTWPTAGTVRFDGVDPARRWLLGAPNGIAFALPHFEPLVGRSALEQVAAPMLGRGFSALRARTAAYGLLRRANVAACASVATAQLSRAEAMRVAVARALITAPALLLVDQSPDLPLCDEGRPLLELLWTVAHHDAIAVVLTTEPNAGVAGVDRAFALDRGSLRRLSTPARIVPLRPIPDTGS